jgi:hypothetical protein
MILVAEIVPPEISTDFTLVMNIKAELDQKHGGI